MPIWIFKNLTSVILVKKTVWLLINSRGFITSWPHLLKASISVLALFSGELLFSNLLNQLQLEIEKNKIVPNT